MSAYVVDDAHIDAMVAAGLRLAGRGHSATWLKSGVPQA